MATLNLAGIDGNAFSIMGEWRKAAKKSNITSAEIDIVLKEAMSSDYNHLLATIMHHTTNPHVLA